MGLLQHLALLYVWFLQNMIGPLTLTVCVPTSSPCRMHLGAVALSQGGSSSTMTSSPASSAQTCCGGIEGTRDGLLCHVEGGKRLLGELERAKVRQEVTSVWVSQGLLKAPESIEGVFFMAELPGRGQ